MTSLIRSFTNKERMCVLYHPKEELKNYENKEEVFIYNSNPKVSVSLNNF